VTAVNAAGGDGAQQGGLAKQGAKDPDDLPTVTAGQLPSAETIEAFESAEKGSAKRILDMLEDQSRRRMDMEQTAARTERLGLLLGLLLVAAFFVVGTVLIFKGHEVPGTLLAVADLGLLVAVFLNRDRSAP
jgi:uncharacterized membrane protein